MQILSGISCVLVALFYVTVSAEDVLPRKGKIINGRDARVGEFPYQVSLQKMSIFGIGFTHHCGGAIVDARHVITAGHCVYGRFTSDFLVLAGVRDLSEESAGVTLELEQVYLHEGYVYPALNDIALLRLKENLPLNNPLISSIPLRWDEPTVPSNCIVSGWGDTRRMEIAQAYPDTLQALEVPLVDFDLCAKLYEEYPYEDVVPGMLCAGYIEGHKDACQGDSGGPLMCDGQLTGLVSWGNNCALPNFPVVYTDVAFYRSWIASTLARSAAEGGLRVSRRPGADLPYPM